MPTSYIPPKRPADSLPLLVQHPTAEREGTVTSNVSLDATKMTQSDPGHTEVHPSARLDSGTGMDSPTRSPTPWRRAYATRLLLSDLFVLVWVAYGTQLLWFGFGDALVATREDVRFPEVSYWLFSAALVVIWMWALSLADSRDHRIIGAGPTEYVRVARASLSLFGAIAIIAFLVRIDIARGYLLIALPLGLLTLVFERWMWRQWLLAHRTMGQYSARVLLVGSSESVAQIAHEFQRSWSAGYVVVGACIPSGRVADTIPGTSIPIMGSVENIERALAATGADTVAVTSTDDLPPTKVKQISWALETGRQHLVLAPSITDIAGPRLQTRPVAGLPLIHVETPKFSRGQRFAKRTMDLVISIVGIIVISPLLLGLALAVRSSSPGPVLFRQVRVGHRGRDFEMLKFRSMVPNAEELLPALLAQRNAGNEILFKMTDDPRVTRVGRFMRKYSLDELPQLFNVVAGNMSLVGPRPPLPSEVEKYAAHVHRRFLMKPGITGAWQVGGRSMLSWEDSVRLDLAYVENWSLVADFLILAKTARAALAPGATAH